ncbi:MAG: type IV secretion system DNA-binding domain-containing protein [Candidatus Moraniibacteriota bacterium]
MENPKITFFAKTNFRNHDRVFGIKEDDRRRHMYIIGKTGMGKTNLLENLAIQDIQNGRGVAYIDPHGDTAEKLIQAIPEHRLKDVIYFNPADQDFPIAFNILEQVAPEYQTLVASGLISVFKKLWADSWGPRLEYILRNALLALLEYPGSTLLGVNRILVDKDYRKLVLEKVTDPMVRSFWIDEFTKWNDRVLQEVISPIQNKVGQFLSNSLIRNVIGQSQSSFDIRDIMDNKKILIMNLSKGRIGEDISGLLGALMITKIQLAAMARVDIPEEERQDFYLYVDEFQNFATDSFANILSEARKYHLNLVLANQYVAQLGEVVRDAIFGNAGTIVSFRVGAVDAEFLEKEFEPVFMMNDIVNLPKYHIYLKLMIDGIAADAFSATTLPPIEIENTVQNTETVIQFSRDRYSHSREEVEEKIRRWSGMLTESERQAIYALKNNAQPSQTPRPQVQPRRVETQDFASHAAPHNPVSSPSPSQIAETKNDAPTQAQPQPRIVETQDFASPAVSPQEIPVAPKEMFTTQCAVCHEEIQVPFKPDGQRPTFCRQHLKEYQRAIVQQREAIQTHQPTTSRTIEPQAFVPHAPQPMPTKITEVYTPEVLPSNPELKTYTSPNPPLSLHQMQFVAPKKFRSNTIAARPRPAEGSLQAFLPKREE